MIKKEKKAQVTVFIILGLAIVIVLFLILRGDTKTSVEVTESPVAELKICLSPKVNEKLRMLGDSGGDLSPQLYYTYNNFNISYLCYTNKDRTPCVMQRPFLKKDFENSLSEILEDNIQSCLGQVRDEYEAKGYSVSIDGVKPIIEILPRRILVRFEGNILFERDASQRFTSLENYIYSDYYDILEIANDIQNSEATFGEADNMIYMIYNPDINIKRIKLDDGTTIYQLKSLKTDEFLQFASRSYNYEWI